MQDKQENSILNNNNTAIIFPGQGSQSVGMSKEIYDNFNIVRELFEETNDILKYDLKKIMFEGPIDILTQTINSQPAIMLSSIAIVKVIEKEIGKKIWELANISAGHSLGEITALCAIDTISFTDTVRILQLRSREMEKCSNNSKGSMIAIVGITYDELMNSLANIIKDNPHFLEKYSIANHNSEKQIILSGDLYIINQIRDLLKKSNIKVIPLKVSGGFHSPLMTDTKKPLENLINNIVFHTPKIDIIQNYPATIVKNISKIKENLVKQVTSTVKWYDTIKLIEMNKIERIVEIGNQTVLTNINKRTTNINSFSINNLESINNFISMF
ncbi:MAG TPA: ACP S-malonyltransferase [Candidatus Megaira endosymbiont of Hartmannula sinica]|nr:ACP S-malonyltransferase [Candidatus Megaera endosymbiont of Hartmannula sinica]